MMWPRIRPTGFLPVAYCETFQNRAGGLFGGEDAWSLRTRQEVWFLVLSDGRGGGWIVQDRVDQRIDHRSFTFPVEFDQ